MYKSFDASDLAFLHTILPPERIVEKTRILSDFFHDELSGTESSPDVLVYVRSTKETSQILRYASEKQIPVTARGSGTGLVGSSVCVHGGIMLSTQQMDQILELDEENLTVTVEPGVLLMTLSEYVEAAGFFYPPDPGEKTATIGGNISTNAGGMRAVKYGVTRDFVRALTVVLPSGEIVELGGKIVKNSSGYSLMNLIIGSEGTLGIITKATLKLLPNPEVSVSLLIPFTTMDDALDCVPKLVRSGTDPTAIEYMSRDIILFAEEYLSKTFPDTSGAAYLLLTYDGKERSFVEAMCEEAGKLCLDNGAMDVYIVDTEERKKSVWPARSAFLEAIKASTDEMDECDVVVPRNQIAAFIKFTHQLAADLSLRIPSFGHAGDGNLHIYLCRDGLREEIFQEKLRRAFDAMYEKAHLFGGQVSGEHGIGYAKRDYLARSLGSEQIKLMRGIKKVFDPLCILNPDKIFRLEERSLS